MGIVIAIRNLLCVVIHTNRPTPSLRALDFVKSNAWQSIIKNHKKASFGDSMLVDCHDFTTFNKVAKSSNDGVANLSLRAQFIARGNLLFYLGCHIER